MNRPPTRTDARRRLETRTARDVLAERARALARTADAPATGPMVRVLVFMLGAERYAVEARRIAGVFRLIELAPVPGANRAIAGVTAWRGALLPVVDLRVVLARATEGLDDRAWVVVLEDRGRTGGVLVGGLQDVIEVPEPDVVAPGERGGRRRVVRGMTPDAVVVLDPGAVLDAAN